MSLSTMPLLTAECLDSFNASKKFYHLSHKFYLKSFSILELAIKQGNLIVEQNRLIEESIREIERSYNLTELLGENEVQEKIKLYRIHQASLLHNLKNINKVIDEQVDTLKPIIEARPNCVELYTFLNDLSKKNSMFKRELAEEQFRHLETSSKVGMFLDKKQFTSFARQIENHGSAALLSRYRKLNWFRPTELKDKDSKLVRLEIDNKPIYALTTLKALFQRQLGMIAQFFFNTKERKQVVKEQFYTVALLRSAQQRIATNLETTTSRSMVEGNVRDLPCTTTIRETEKLLSDKKDQVEKKIVTGLNGHFYRFKNLALDTELQYLRHQYLLLQEKRLDFIERTWDVIESNYHINKLILPSHEKLCEIESLIAESESNIRSVPQDSPLVQEFTSRLEFFKNRYKVRRDISAHFVKNVLNNDKYFTQAHAVSDTGLSYLQCSKERLSVLITSLKEYVTRPEQEAFDVLEDLLIGRKVSNLHYLKEKLLPLFRSDERSEKYLDLFLDKIITQYLIPSLHNPKSDLFKLLSEYNPAYVEKWVVKRTVSLEDALLFLQTIYIENTQLDHKIVSIGYKSFSCDKVTFSAQINLLKSFENISTGKSYLESFLQIIQRAIVKWADTLCSKNNLLDGVLQLDNDIIKIQYIQALVASCLKQDIFHLLHNSSLIDYLNENVDAIIVIKTLLQSHFKLNRWNPSLQNFLRNLNDQTLAQDYETLYIKKIIDDKDFASQESKVINPFEETIENHLGEHNMSSIFKHLSNALASERFISSDSLTMIDILLKKEWPQDVRPLTALFEIKRKMLVDHSEVSFEIKDILSLIKKSDWKTASSRIKEHLLLCFADELRSKVHYTVVLDLLNQLYTIEQGYKQNVQHKETLPARQQRWSFYQDLHGVLKETQSYDLKNRASQQEALISAFRAIEKDFLLQVNPIAYFLTGLSQLLKAGVTDVAKFLVSLNTLKEEINNNIPANAKDAINKIFELITGKWIPESPEELRENVDLLFRGLDNYFSSEEMIQLLLTSFVLPRVRSLNSPEFLLLYRINPSLVDKVILQEKRKIEDDLYKFKNVLINNNYSKQSLLPTKDEIKDCQSAIGRIIYFSQWQKEHLLDKNDLSKENKPEENEKNSYYQTLLSILQEYIALYKRSIHKTLHFVSLIDTCGNKELLDEYLKSWLVDQLFTNKDYAQLNSNEVFVKYRDCVVIQETFKTFILENHEKIEKWLEEIKLNNMASMPGNKKYCRRSEELFPLINLLHAEAKKEVISIIFGNQSIWRPKWQAYLDANADQAVKQNYRCLYLRNLFSNKSFAEKCDSLCPELSYSSFEDHYGKDNLPGLLELMDEYVLGEFDSNKIDAYKFIHNSLKNDICTGPWQLLKERVHQHLLFLEEKNTNEVMVKNFLDMVRARQYADVKNLAEKWILSAKSYKESDPEFTRYNQLFVGCLEKLKVYIQDQSKNCSGCEIAMVRDYILPAFPNSKGKMTLVNICNKATRFQYNKNNSEVRDLYYKLQQFENFVWKNLKRLLPHITEDQVTQLKLIANISVIRHEDTLHYNLDRLEKEGHYFGVEREVIKFYRQNEEIISRSVYGVILANYHFQNIGLAHKYGQPTDKKYIDSVSNNIRSLQNHLRERTTLLKNATTGWFNFFRAQSSPNDTGNEVEPIQILVSAR